MGFGEPERDPAHYVKDGIRPVTALNELEFDEFVRGEIFATVWQTDHIARISPSDGRVLGWIDLAGLIPKTEHLEPEAVLNGIAYDPAGDRLFVTGKLWPKIFEIKLIPKKKTVNRTEAGGLPVESSRGSSTRRSAS